MTVFSKVMAMAAALLPAVGLFAAGAPKYVAVAPMCEDTVNWDQAGSLDAKVAEGDPKGRSFHCGCDPLAWGQVLMYHANHRGYPAKAWRPTPLKRAVRFYDNGEQDSPFAEVTREVTSEAYDWATITEQSKNIWAENPDLSRLLRDLGTIGCAQYAPGGTKTSLGTVKPADDEVFELKAGQSLFSAYFGFKSIWNFPMPLRPHPTDPTQPQIVQTNWAEMADALLRGSLEAGLPMVVSINMSGGGHAIICDGYGFDEKGKPWYHLHYGYGAGQQPWVPTAWFAGVPGSGPNEFTGMNPNTSPDDVQGIVTGRVSAEYKNGPEGVAGASVSLTYTAPQAQPVTLETVTTEDTGCYVFTGIPEQSQVFVTVTFRDKVYTAEGATKRFLDERLRKQLEDASPKGSPYIEFEQGNLVLDVTVDTPPVPVVYAAPGGTGDGSAWAQAAGLNQALLDRAATVPRTEVYLLEGTYWVAGQLTVPAGLVLKGGFKSEDGTRDVLGARSVLRSVAGAHGVIPSYAAELRPGAVLDGLVLQPAAELGNCYINGGTAVNCVFEPSPSGWPKNIATSATVTTSWICLTEAFAESAAFVHCTFAGAAPMDKDGSVVGCRFDAGADDLYAGTDLLQPCACGQCPETGLDGRPLKGTPGAVATNAPAVPETVIFVPDALGEPKSWSAWLKQHPEGVPLNGHLVLDFGAVADGTSQRFVFDVPVSVARLTLKGSVGGTVDCSGSGKLSVKVQTFVRTSAVIERGAAVLGAVTVAQDAVLTLQEDTARVLAGVLNNAGVLRLDGGSAEKPLVADNNGTLGRVKLASGAVVLMTNTTGGNKVYAVEGETSGVKPVLRLSAKANWGMSQSGSVLKHLVLELPAGSPELWMTPGQTDASVDAVFAKPLHIENRSEPLVFGRFESSAGVSNADNAGGASLEVSELCVTGSGTWGTPVRVCDGGRLHVRSGAQVTLNFKGHESLAGDVTVESGASLISGAEDAPKYSGAQTFDIAGTLQVNGVRWSLGPGAAMTLREGAVLKGTGENDGTFKYAYDFFEGTTLKVVGNATLEGKLGAHLSDKTLTLNVARDKALTAAAGAELTGTASKYQVTGAGMLVLDGTCSGGSLTVTTASALGGDGRVTGVLVFEPGAVLDATGEKVLTAERDVTLSESLTVRLAEVPTRPKTVLNAAKAAVSEKLRLRVEVGGKPAAGAYELTKAGDALQVVPVAEKKPGYSLHVR